MSKNSLTEYYKALSKNPYLSIVTDEVNNNTLHAIVINENDATTKEDKENLALNCLNVILNEYGIELFSNYLQEENKHNKTPIELAMQDGNVYFLEALSRVKNNYFEKMIWDYLENELPSIISQKWVLNKFFDINEEKFVNLEGPNTNELIISAKNEHLFFILELFKEHNITIDEKHLKILSDKVVLSKKLNLLKILIQEDIQTFDMNHNQLLDFILDSLNQDDSNMIAFFLTNYNYDLALLDIIASRAPEIVFYEDSNGNNLFHKLAMCKKINNINPPIKDIIGKLMKFISVNNRPHNQEHSENTLSFYTSPPVKIPFFRNNCQDSPIDLALANKSIDFIKCYFENKMFSTLNLLGIYYKFISETVQNNLLTEEKNEIRKLIHDHYTEQTTGTKFSCIKNLESEPKLISILIETAQREYFDLIIDIFQYEKIDINFQSFSFKPERKTSGANNTLLHKAVLWDDKATVLTLLTLKADTNLKNKEGFTPFSLAVAKNNHAIIDILLTTSEVNVKTKDGNTVFHLIAMQSNGHLFDEDKKLLSTEQNEKNNNGFSCEDFLGIMHYNEKFTLNKNDYDFIEFSNVNIDN